MLELLTQKPVLPTAVSSSQKPAGESDRGGAPSVDEDGKSFSQSLEQETRAADAASSKDTPRERTAPNEDEAAESQTGMPSEVTSQSTPEVNIADGEAIDPANAPEDLVEAAPQLDGVAPAQAVTDETADTRPNELTAAALPTEEQAIAPTQEAAASGDENQASAAPKDAVLASTEAKNLDPEVAKPQTVSDHPEGAALNKEPSSQDGDVEQAAIADTAEKPQQTAQTPGAEIAKTDASKAASEGAAPQVGAASAQTNSAAQPAKGDPKTPRTVQPAQNAAPDGAPLNANPEQQGEVVALKERAQTGVQDQELAEAKTGKQDNAPKLDASPAAARPASFEAALTAQNQALDPAAALGLSKAPAVDALAAKPLPEVTVQVPQQRADMAAKQMGLELAKQAKNGDTHFIVRMDPPELGKLDVRLTINKAGEVQANILVDRESTLDLLNRDARTLERSLTDAGLKMDQNALNLGLKNQDPKGGEMGQTANGPQGSGETSGNEDGDDLPPVIDGATLAQMQISSGRPLDVVI